MRISSTRSRITLLAAAALVAACSPLSLLNAVVPTDGYMRTADVSYGKLPRQKLDVYVPDAPATETLKPVVIFFYGGGWEGGDRTDYGFVAEALTSRGYVVVVPDYRVYPEVLFADFMADSANAVHWVRSNVARYGGDPQRIFLMGHSAGAHIAAMLTLDERYLDAVGVKTGGLRGMIGLAGPYDFLPFIRESSKLIFGPEANYWRSQPINFVNGHNPAMLLLTGNDDTIVHPGNTANLAAKIKARGGPVQVVEYPGLGHAGILVQLAAPFRGSGDVLQAVTEFVRENSNAASSHVTKAESQASQ